MEKSPEEVILCLLAVLVRRHIAPFAPSHGLYHGSARTHHIGLLGLVVLHLILPRVPVPHVFALHGFDNIVWNLKGRC